MPEPVRHKKERKSLAEYIYYVNVWARPIPKVGS